MADLSNISSVIDAKQKELTQVGGKISKVPIYLRINKQNFFDLTLVDLPGLIYTDGLGPFIQSIYADYIQNPNSIVLYVTSATTDLVTGQSIEFIDQYDSEWQRTMAIITKIDARDQNFLTHFRQVDKGLGAICVRNKTKAENDAGISFNDLLGRESVILAEEDFTEIPAEQKGIPMLIQALVTHQREMILKFKPVLRQRLVIYKDQLQKQLQSLPKCFKTIAEKNSFFLQMLQKFSFTLNDVVRNSKISLDQSQENKTMFLRGRVQQIFDEHSKDFSNLKLKFFEPRFRRQIKELIAEDQGINPSNFMNVQIFKLEIQKRISEAGEDSAKLVEKVK